MNRKRLRVVLVEQDKRFVDLHRETGISYNRLIRLANGYCDPKGEELSLIASALGLQVEELMRPVDHVG